MARPFSRIADPGAIDTVDGTDSLDTTLYMPIIRTLTVTVQCDYQRP